MRMSAEGPAESDGGLAQEGHTVADANLKLRLSRRTEEKFHGPPPKARREVLEQKGESHVRSVSPLAVAQNRSSHVISGSADRESNPTDRSTKGRLCSCGNARGWRHPDPQRFDAPWTATL